MKLAVSQERMLEAAQALAKSLQFSETEAFINGRLLEGTGLARSCVVLLHAKDPHCAELAAKIIDRAQWRMCHFTPFIVSRVVLDYGDQLPQRCIDKIKVYLQSIRHENVDNELDFVGVNDNFPFMATYTATAFWHIFRDAEMLDTAYRRFGQLERLLKRRGVMSEYNSMTYTPVQLVALAGLARIAPDQRCKEIAMKAQHRIWFDTLAHYHPEVGNWSGPFSRHYIRAGQDIFFLLQQLLDLKVVVPGNPENWFDVTEEYDCPDAALKLVTDKQYPFVVAATSEYTASTDATPEAARRDMTREDDTYEYGAGVSGLYTYQTARYGLGTATNEWHNGVQTSSFFVNYRRNDIPKTRADSRYVYCRYLLNDETVQSQKFYDQGRKMAFGRENQALVLYKPKIACIPSVASGTITESLAAHYRNQEISGNLGVTSAKLVIMIPLEGVKPDCVMLGQRVLETCEGWSDTAECVAIQDGGMYLAFHPLHITDLGRECAMRVRIRDGELEIALYNYFGQAKDFAKRHFLHVRNGFLFSAGSVEECGSFAAFLEREAQTVIEDRMITSNHARQTYIRAVEARTSQRTLSCEYAPASESIKFIACDDYAVEFPKLSITGVDSRAIPFL